MNIANALKEKNRLVRKMRDTQNKIREYNSILKGNARPYSIRELMNELTQTVEDLIEVKTRIAHANQTVQSKIFRLSELRSQVDFLRTLNVREGKVASSTHFNTDVQEYESEVTPKDRDTLITQLETEIDQLQNELDRFNFETEV